MEHESGLAGLHTNKLSWDYSAFVRYALEVIAIVKQREKAESVRKRALESK